MGLDRILLILQFRPATLDRARELAQFAYLEWLVSLPGDGDFLRAARDAHERASAVSLRTPAIAAFCDLLVEARQTPFRALDLIISPPSRRGGASSRRILS